MQIIDVSFVSLNLQLKGTSCQLGEPIHSMHRNKCKHYHMYLEMLPFTDKFVTRISFSCIRDKTESLEMKYVDKFRWDTKNLF